MATKKKEEKKISPKKAERNNLVGRVMEAKNRLPDSGVTTMFFQKHAKLDTPENRSKLNNVLQYRTSDLQFTMLLEELADLYTAMLED